MAAFVPNLYLVGFMGTGKTTIGRALGQRLRMTVIDSDQIVVLRKGVVLGVGTHKQLLKTVPLYRDLAETQLLTPVEA
jgi:ABC-type transport system involved in Fe-S cluster assembly fused permease/ATPase subunit